MTCNCLDPIAFGHARTCPLGAPNLLWAVPRNASPPSWHPPHWTRDYQDEP